MEPLLAQHACSSRSITGNRPHVTARSDISWTNFVELRNHYGKFGISSFLISVTRKKYKLLWNPVITANSTHVMWKIRSGLSRRVHFSKASAKQKQQHTTEKRNGFLFLCPNGCSNVSHFICSSTLFSLNQVNGGSGSSSGEHIILDWIKNNNCVCHFSGNYISMKDFPMNWLIFDFCYLRIQLWTAFIIINI